MHIVYIRIPCNWIVWTHTLSYDSPRSFTAQHVQNTFFLITHVPAHPMKWSGSKNESLNQPHTHPMQRHSIWHLHVAKQKSGDTIRWFYRLVYICTSTSVCVMYIVMQEIEYNKARRCCWLLFPLQLPCVACKL